ncbi:recombinase family protein [Catenibacterium sp.]
MVIYVRVSTKNQKDDLINQVAFLRQFCNVQKRNYCRPVY